MKTAIIKLKTPTVISMMMNMYPILSGSQANIPLCVGLSSHGSGTHHEDRTILSTQSFRKRCPIKGCASICEASEALAALSDAVAAANKTLREQRFWEARGRFDMACPAGHIATCSSGTGDWTSEHGSQDCSELLHKTLCGKVLHTKATSDSLLLGIIAKKAALETQTIAAHATTIDMSSRASCSPAAQHNPDGINHGDEQHYRPTDHAQTRKYPQHNPETTGSTFVCMPLVCTRSACRGTTSIL